MVWKYKTGQDVEHVSNYLKDKGLSFTFDDRLPAFYIDHPDPEKHYIAYQYYYTTGRWGLCIIREIKTENIICVKI